MIFKSYQVSYQNHLQVHAYMHGHLAYWLCAVAAYMTPF